MVPVKQFNLMQIIVREMTSKAMMSFIRFAPLQPSTTRRLHSLYRFCPLTPLRNTRERHQGRQWILDQPPAI